MEEVGVPIKQPINLQVPIISVICITLCIRYIGSFLTSDISSLRDENCYNRILEKVIPYEVSYPYTKELPVLHPALRPDHRLSLSWIEYCCSEAICAAANGEDKLVNFAVLIAQNYKLYNTQCNAGSTVLHMAAEKCTADTVRNLITKGANGAIADCWGKLHCQIFRVSAVRWEIF